MRRESAPFLHVYPPREILTDAPGWAAICGPPEQPVLVVESGVGMQRAERVLQWLPRRPSLVVSAGFSGALNELYRVGDVVLATDVCDLEGRRWPTTWPAGPSSLPRGRLLTVPRLISEPGEKRVLGRRYEADAADMETAAVARWCSERGVPFGCVRAISDDVATALSPRLVSLLAVGRVAPWRVGAALVRSPRLVGELWRLARDTRLAAKRLREAMRLLLRSSVPADQMLRNQPPAAIASQRRSNQ
jgi:hypothetical protein